MAGGMEVNKNKFLEEWVTGRENLEYNFRWTRRNLAIVGIFGIAVPVLLYKGIVREFVREPNPNSERIDPLFLFLLLIANKTLTLIFLILVWLQHMQDEDAGRPYRKFL